VQKQVGRVMHCPTFQKLLQAWGVEFSSFKAGLCGDVRESLDELDELNTQVWQQYGIPVGEGGLPTELATIESYGILQFPGMSIGNHYGTGKHPAIMARQVQSRQYMMKSPHEVGGKWLGAVVMSGVHAVVELLCMVMGGLTSLSFDSVDRTTFALTGNKYFMFNLQHDETRSRYMDFSHWTALTFDQDSKVIDFHRSRDSDAKDQYPISDVVTDDDQIYVRLQKLVDLFETFRGEGEVCSTDNVDLADPSLMDLCRENGYSLSEATPNQVSIMYFQANWANALWRRHKSNAAASAWFHGHWVAVVDFAKHLLHRRETASQGEYAHKAL